MAKTRKKLKIFNVLAVIAIVSILTFGSHDVITKITLRQALASDNFKFIETDVPIPPADNVANIVAIGDTLCHSQNFKDAYDSSTGIYDFSPMFKYVTKYFENATVAVGNLEATLAGPERGYSGYPTFNTPEHLAIDLKELGLDVMTTANNHTLDIGYNGLVSSLNYLDEAGLAHTGSARSVEEQNTILFQDLNGIKTAFLAFTYGTNGIPVPKGKEYCVNLIDKDLIKSKIDQAKSEGAELICVSMHWGDEYHTKPNSTQEDLAEFLIKNDVKVILGCHPHVLEPMEMKTVTMEDGTTKTGFVIYSMGNFFSAQTYDNTRNTLILNVQVRENGKTGEVTIDNATYTPVYVFDNNTGGNPNSNGSDRYELLDIETIISEYETGTGNWNERMYNLAKTELNRTVNILGPEIFNNTNDNQEITNTVETQ